MTDSGDCRLSG